MSPAAASFVVDAVRTPFGRYGGALAGVRPDDLAATCCAVCSSATRLWTRPASTTSGSATRTRPARTTATSPAWRRCSPGCRRRCRAPRSTGCAARVSRPSSAPRGRSPSATPTIAVAGGVESMSRAPWVMLKPETPYARGHETLWSTTLGWRMVNPAMPARGRSRSARARRSWPTATPSAARTQDAFAVAAHRNAARAWDAGVYADEVVAGRRRRPRSRREHPADSSAEKLARLKPVFRPDGTVTAGNSSPLNDGAAALLVGDEAGAESLGHRTARPDRLAASSGVDPDVFGIGPVQAARDALAGPGSAGRTWWRSS